MCFVGFIHILIEAPHVLFSVDSSVHTIYIVCVLSFTIQSLNLSEYHGGQLSMEILKICFLNIFNPKMDL